MSRTVIDPWKVFGTQENLECESCQCFPLYEQQGQWWSESMELKHELDLWVRIQFQLSQHSRTEGFLQV